MSISSECGFCFISTIITDFVYNIIMQWILWILQDNYKSKGKQSRIHLLEYEKPDWTYHAKGLWYYLPGKKLPVMTLIGSSNFGERSVNRDLEAQVCIVTTSSSLQQRLNRECERLFSIGAPAEEAITLRAIPRWVRAVVRQFRNFF